MDFNLTEEHLMIQKAARDFAVAELLPGVIKGRKEKRKSRKEVKEGSQGWKERRKEVKK